MGILCSPFHLKRYARRVVLFKELVMNSAKQTPIDTRKALAFDSRFPFQEIVLILERLKCYDDDRRSFVKIIDTRSGKFTYRYWPNAYYDSFPEKNSVLANHSRIMLPWELKY